MIRRLAAQTSADAGISAFPEGDNIFNWVGTIAGGAQTVYEGLKFKLTLGALHRCLPLRAVR